MTLAPLSPAQPTLPGQLHKFMTGLALSATLGLVAQGFLSTATVGAEPPAPHKTQITAGLPLQNGTYLYGQATQSGQIGTTYLVFEVHQNRVVGGFYMPHSSFDCAYGTLQSNQLALTVVNSEDRTSYPYSIAIQRAGLSASQTGSIVPPATLADYHALPQLSAIDRKVLATCKTAQAR